MGFKNGAYCTVWNTKTENKVVVAKEKYAEVNLTISKKKQDGTYETDFESRVRFIGKAFNKIKDLALEEKDKLKLTEVETTYKYNKEAQKPFWSFVCWDFETVDPVKKEMPKVEVVDLPPLDVDDSLPF